MFFVLLVLVVGLSIVSNRIWGGKPELPQKRQELRIDAGMTIIQFGQANNLPDAVLKEIYDLTGTIRDMTKENGGTILGPRQSGKTTLAQMTFPDKPYFSLEDPDVLMAAEADPRGFLNQMVEGGIVDELQRLPSLLSYLQGIVDRTRKRGLFILTGSHQPRLHKAISQSLAGRTAMLTLWPFSFNELLRYKLVWSPFDLIYRGFFPRLHEENLEPRRFFNGYVQTYVERDVRALIQLRDLSLFQQFLTLLAGRIGPVVSFASLGSDVGALPAQQSETGFPC